jgi:hypothetical protein
VEHYSKDEEVKGTYLKQHAVAGSNFAGGRRGGEMISVVEMMSLDNRHSQS